MRVVICRVRSVTAAMVIALVCTPAYATDPLTLLLLRVLRDKIISYSIESAVDNATPTRSTPPLAPMLPGLSGSLFAGFDDAQLRRLIDEGFVHLNSAQRDEVYASVRRIIADPKNAADVPEIIADLAVKASGVRQAHEQLNTLSLARKRLIAVEAREAYEKMPVDSREQMASVLRQRLVPLPVDLTEMILSEFDRVQAQAAVSTPSVAAAEASASALPAEPAASPTNAN